MVIDVQSGEIEAATMSQHSSPDSVMLKLKQYPPDREDW